MKKLITILLIFSSLNLLSQEKKLLPTSDWNGYTQLRASSNFENNTNFSLRRLKFWLKSTPEFSEHWSYKLQTTISSKQQEKFFLQDVKVSYKTGLFSFDFGQFIPAYSLEWSQPDYKIPTMERAKAIDAISPSASLGVRDIGVQANFTSKNKLFQSSLGVFNGQGIKTFDFNNKTFMLSQKSAINISLQKNKIQFGYSVQYRKANNLKIPKVLPDTVFFTGNDFRYNFFALYKSKYFELQAEYLNANFEASHSNGWYFLSTFNLGKNQIVFSYEDYNDLISTTNNEAHFHLGYNYLINKHKIKLYLDNSFQIIDNKLVNNLSSVQLQLFFK